jgi:hypothetical protein
MLAASGHLPDEAHPLVLGSNGSPSFNHCWMIWDRQHGGPATLAYACHD